MEGLRFGVWGCGFGVEGSWLRVWGSRLRVEGLEFRVQGIPSAQPSLHTTEGVRFQAKRDIRSQGLHMEAKARIWP